MRYVGKSDSRWIRITEEFRGEWSNYWVREFDVIARISRLWSSSRLIHDPRRQCGASAANMRQQHEKPRGFYSELIISNMSVCVDVRLLIIRLTRLEDWVSRPAETDAHKHPVLRVLFASSHWIKTFIASPGSGRSRFVRCQGRPLLTSAVAATDRLAVGHRGDEATQVPPGICFIYLFIYLPPTRLHAAKSE